MSTFCVPRRQADWAPTVCSSDRSPIDYDPASVIDHYLSLLEQDLKKTREELTGGFFKSAHGKGARFFRQVPMGKNLIEKVGREMAEELFLPNPATYTSHCWRRSCGTNSSNAGVNVTTLMSHLGWTTPKTAIGYVQKSKMTSYNMAMFLSNVQRQNKDIDDVFSLLKSFISEHRPNPESPKSPKSPEKKKKKVEPKTKVVKTLIPLVVEKEVDVFSSLLSSARNSSSRVKIRKTEKVEAEKEETVGSVDEVEQSLDVSELEVVRSDFGGGGGESLNGEETGRLNGEETGNGGGVGARAAVGGVGGGGLSSYELDPRVSSILSNLSNHGEIHVHFHFGNS